MATAVLVAVVSAVAAPNVSGYFDQKRIAETADMLAEARDGLSALGTGFRHTVGANAGRLSELTTQIWNSGSGTAPYPRNSCGEPFSNAQVSNWDGAGPFVSYFIPAAGLVTPIGVASDALERVPNAAAGGTSRIVIANVSMRDATLLDEHVDGGNGMSAGTVVWTAPRSGAVTLYYQLSIDNRC